MENGPFIVDFPIKIVIFHSYVSLPEGKFFTGTDKQSWLSTMLSVLRSLGFGDLQRLGPHKAAMDCCGQNQRCCVNTHTLWLCQNSY